MISLLFLAIVSFVAYKTNPDELSFKSFISGESQKTTGESSSFISRLFRRGANVGPYDRKDYGLFCLVTLKKQSVGTKFLGIFGFWIPLDSLTEVFSTRGLPTTNPGGETPSMQTDAAESYFQQALEYKRKRSMILAANSFLKAAKYADSPFSAGTYYEEAFKCFNYEKDYENSIRSLESGLACFQDIGKYGKCGKLCEMISELCIKSENIVQAADKLLQAADFFAKENDKRASVCNGKALDYLIMCGKSEQALKLSQSVIPEIRDDNLLRFQLPAKLFTLCLIHVRSGDWVALSTALSDYTENVYPGFEASREYEFLWNILQCAQQFDGESYEALVESYIKISPLDNWKLEILREAKKSFANQDLT